jgi:excisionase family DNA binding protein
MWYSLDKFKGGHNTMTTEIFTVEEAARYLHFHPETIRRFIREKKLKATKINGGRYRLTKANADAFVRGQEQAEEVV